MRLAIPAVILALTACGTDRLTSTTEPDVVVLWTDGAYAEIGCTWGALTNAPVARGLALPLSVMTANGTTLDYFDGEADLSIVDDEGQSVPFERVSGARFRTRFENTGWYHLTATFPDGRTLTQGVVVTDQAGLRLSPDTRFMVTRDSGGECEQPLELTSALPPLAQNQALRVSVVPVDVRGKALLGELNLEFTGTVTARASTPLLHNNFLLEGGRAGTNTLRIDDKAGFSTEVSLEFTEQSASCPKP